VGTLATGTWEADTIAIAQGGTGATSLSNLFALGTHTTGNYMTDVSAGTLVDVSHTPGEGSTATVNVDLTEAAEAAIANGDYLLFLDGGATGTHAKEAVHDLATLFAGTGLTASSSVIGVDASQTQITAVGTIATGTWEGTTVAVAQGGTGATSLSNLITMGTHTAGDYVAAITAGTGLTSTGATSGETISHSLSVDASQTQITAVGTIATGTWSGTDVAVAAGGTGSSTASGARTNLGLGTAAVAATGISNTNVPVFTSGVADNDFLRVDGTNIEGRSAAEVLSDIGAGVAAGSSSIVTVGTIGTGAWAATDVAVAHGGTGASTATAGFDALSPMSAEGDVIYGGSSGTVTRLGKGDNDQVLTLASGVPVWASVPAGAASSLDATSSGANLPVVRITNTHADATAGFIKFVKDPGSGQGADADILGTITWYGTDASNNAIEELARIESYIIEADHGSEAAGMKFYVAENDATMTAGLQILGQATDDGEIDVTIGAGAASTTTIAGTLTMGSTVAMTNAGLVSVANQSGITGVGTISSGTWEGTTVAVAQGGTGATSLSNLITLATHTTGDYVQNITAGTGLTSSGATSGENIAHSLSVDASQTQITAVGTIATGTWAATDVAVLHGGTGASTATAGFDALSPMTTQGDILYGGSSGTVTRLARGSDNQTLMMNGTSPNWETVTVGATAGFSVAMAIAL
jgi:hypothetical protein